MAVNYTLQNAGSLMSVDNNVKESHKAANFGAKARGEWFVRFFFRQRVNYIERSLPVISFEIKINWNFEAKRN